MNDFKNKNFRDAYNIASLCPMTHYEKKASYSSVLFHSIDAKKTDIAIDNTTTVLAGQVETCDS